uniref:Uncharacterized protein n=1 Tax=Anguilla anguilla TaxID=7936 RepID=A0A0E9XIB6_ANGAN
MSITMMLEDAGSVDNAVFFPLLISCK